MRVRIQYVSHEKSPPTVLVDEVIKILPGKTSLYAHRDADEITIEPTTDELTQDSWCLGASTRALRHKETR